MLVSEAVALIGGVGYKPGWTFSAAELDRYENAIVLRIRYEVQNSDAIYAPEYREPVVPVPTMDFLLTVHDCQTDTDLWGKVIECLLQVERHETRELFSVHSDHHDKPFHPHTTEGMTNWACRKPVAEMEDVSLGLLSYA